LTPTEKVLAVAQDPDWKGHSFSPEQSSSRKSFHCNTTVFDSTRSHPYPWDWAGDGPNTKRTKKTTLG